MWPEAVLIVGAYLLGSFPLLYLLGRLHGVDLKQYEDSHIALWRHVGRVQGAAGVIFDFMKGVIVVLVARAVGFGPEWVATAGVVTVVGQMWPVFEGFDGEKGNSTGLAMSLALAPTGTAVAMIPMAIGFFVRTIPRFRKRNQTMKERFMFGGPPSLSLPFGMAVGFAVLPLTVWLVPPGQPLPVVLALVGLFVLIMVRRVTAGLSKDLQQPGNRGKMMLNRLLFDRSQT